MTAPLYIKGETNPQMAVIGDSQVASVGDMMTLISNTAIRAADVTWNSTLAATQADCVAGFLGVSAQDKDSSHKKPYGNSVDNRIRVNTGPCIVEFNCGSATFHQGDRVGPAKDSGNALLSDTVVAVGSDSLSIGHVAEEYASATTRVRVQIRSKILPQAY